MTRDKSGRFLKGHLTWNKGKKGVNGFSTTRFPKGHLPWNTKEIGTYRKTRDGIQVKCQNNKWIPYSRIVWQQYYGEIPEGFIIWHKNGDKFDDRIENLECVSRAVMVRMAKRQAFNKKTDFLEVEYKIAQLENLIMEKEYVSE